VDSVFVFQAKGGRTVELIEPRDTRYRDAAFSSDGERIITLSDESGELEFVSLPANGIGDPSIITKNGDVLRYAGKPSPDGKWIAYDDLENHMFILNIETGVSRLISNNEERITSFNWSPDSRWISFGQKADNTMEQILIYNLEEDASFPLTTDRANSSSSCWSPDGKFIYFISDRIFTTLVDGPWGPRQPEPYFDASEKLYHIALEKGSRSPFRPSDELFDEKSERKEKGDSIHVKIDRDGILERMVEVPISAGNYRGLEVSGKAIYLMTGATDLNAKVHLGVLKVGSEDVKIERFVDDVQSFEMTSDKKKILIRKRNDIYMVPAGTSKVGKIVSHKIDLKNWKIAITPREDWKQIFTDA
jgi:tricorn protease